jgi:hypothetical protein
VSATNREFTPMLRYKHLIRTAVAPLVRTAVAVGFAIMLSGCVVYPAWGPYYHPHHWGY